MKAQKSILHITQAAIIAALYVVLTYLAEFMGLASGVIQLRLSEALTILPYFTPAAVPGLFVGCLLANLLTGLAPWDILFGSLATLLGAFGTLLIAKSKMPKEAKKWTAPLPPILCNTIIVPLILKLVSGAAESLPFLMLTVGIGEVLSCGLLGLFLLYMLDRYARNIFRQS